MATCSIPIEYVEANRLLVCRLCECAVSGSQLERHISGPRHRLLKHNTAANRQALVARLGTHAAYNLDELRRPTEAVEVIPGLPLYKNGLACKFPDSGCTFIVRDSDSMMRHCKRVHGWKNPVRPGKHRDAEERKLLPWTANVLCQRFMPKGPHAHFFQVTLPPGHPAAMPDEVPERDPLQPLSRPCEEKLGWTTYASGYDRAALSKLSMELLPDQEPLLRLISDRMLPIVNTCVRTSIKYISKSSRNQNERIEFLETTLRFSHSDVQSSTISQYTKQWLRMIRTVLRLYHHERLDADRRFSQAVSAELTLPKLGLSKLQARQTRSLLQTAQACIELDSSSHPSETARKTRGVGLAAQDDDLSPLDWEILEWCLCLFDQHLTSTFVSPVLCALAIMGVARDGWEDPSQFTDELLAILKILRVMTQQRSWHASSAIVNNKLVSESALAASIARETEKLLTSHKSTSIRYLLDNLESGLKLENADAADGACIWHGNELSLKDFRLSRSKLQELVRSLLSAARRVLAEKILFVSYMAQLPSIDWSSIADNPINHSSGYTCTIDENNYFLVDAIEWFDSKLRADKKVAGYFLKDVAKQIHKEGNIKQERVQAWMNCITKFKESLLLLMYISGGMPVSLEEILSLRYRNDTIDLQRNIYIEKGLVLFEIKPATSHKATRSEQIIRRYLPQQVGELLFYYLWLVLPNQRRLEVLQDSQMAESSFVWPPEADVDKRRWTKARLKAALENASVDSIGIKLNITSYRLAAAAFVEMYIGEDLVHEVMTESESEDDELHGESLHNEAQKQLRNASRVLSTQWHELLGFPFTDLYQHSYREKSTPAAIRGKTSAGKRQLDTQDEPVVTKRQKDPGMNESFLGKKPLKILSDAAFEDAQKSSLLTNRPAGQLDKPTADVTQIGEMYPDSELDSPFNAIGNSMFETVTEVRNSRKLPAQEISRSIQAEKPRATSRASEIDTIDTLLYRSEEQREALDRILEGQARTLAAVLPDH